MFKEVITTEVYEDGKLISRDRKVNTNVPTLADIEREASEPEISWEPLKPLRDKVEKCQKCDVICDDSCYPGDPCCYDIKQMNAAAPYCYCCEDGEDCVANNGEWEIESYELSDDKLRMIMFADRFITMLIGAGAAILFAKRLRK